MQKATHTNAHVNTSHK